MAMENCGHWSIIPFYGENSIFSLSSIKQHKVIVTQGKYILLLQSLQAICLAEEEVIEEIMAYHI